jgi:hypothetical protein
MPGTIPQNYDSTASFEILSNLSFIYRRFIQRYIVLAAEKGAVKYSI